MAMRQKEKEKRGKLTLTPSLEPSYVREQLQDAVRAEDGSAVEIPEGLISAVSKTGSPAKLAEVSKALAKIATATRAQAASAFSVLAQDDISKALLKNPGKIASSIIKLGLFLHSDAVAASALLQTKELAPVFAKNPEKIANALIKIAVNASGEADKDAFWVLGRKKFLTAFSKNPKRISAALAKIGMNAGDAAGAAFWVLAKKELASAFVQNPEKIASVLASIGKAAKAGAEDAFWLLGNADVAPVFAQEPERIASALIKIAKSAGTGTEGAFSVLNKKELASAFAQNPEKITGVFAQLGESAGEDSISTFTSLAQGRLPQFLVKNPEQIERIAKACGEGVAVALQLLTLKPFEDAFSSKASEVADALVQVGRAAGKDAGYALGALSSLGAWFASEPMQAAQAFSKASGICGRDRFGLFLLLLQEPVSEAILADPEKLLKLAEAASYSTVLSELHSLAEKNDGKSKREMSSIMRLLDAPDKLAGKFGVPALLKYKDAWKDGKKLARAAGITTKEREVFINFAYAADTIGGKKAKAIHKEFGIEYFARYSKEMLEGLYGHIGEEGDNRPLMVCACGKFDHNGAFYNYGHLQELWDNGYYNMIFIEMDTQDEFYEKMEKFGEKYFGINTLLLSAHGSESLLRLGYRDDDQYILDLSDESRMQELSSLFTGDPLVILNSCSTAKHKDAIAALLSRLWGTELLASEEKTTIERFLTEKEGRITGVEYEEGGARFKDGVEVSPSP